MIRLVATHWISLEATAKDADAFQQLLHFAKETDVKNGSCKVDVAKVSRTLCLSFTTRLALVVTVDRA